MIAEKYRVLSKTLNEQERRVWAAVEAQSLGRGGASLVARATGLSRNTIRAGMMELEKLSAAPPGTRDKASPRRVRRPGAGRKRLTDKDEALLTELEALVEPMTRGDPMSPLRWTCKSTQKLAAELRLRGRAVSARTVAKLLVRLRYSLQANRKVLEGASHPDRNGQFEHINALASRFRAAGKPVISVDTKKKELIGPFKNGGREWRPKGCPEKVNDHDFPDEELGKAIPYGVYDVQANRGWVNVGLDHDTPEFAVQSIRAWWLQMGLASYPEALELLIMADCGGSNGYRVRAWKTQLQRLANETKLSITVCHFPPGTSKWNKIEHRMFCHITQNWRGRPLTTYETVVSLIGATTTKPGLRIQAQLDGNSYEKGVKITDAELARVRLRKHEFHGEWNYTISPLSSPLNCSY